MRERILPIIPRVIPWLLLGSILILGIGSARHKSLTYDENGHYQYGRRTLHLNTDRTIDTTMPISALNAAPKELGRLLPQGLIRFLLSKFITARAVTVLFSLALGSLCYRWSNGIYGWHAAVLTLFLYAFEPNFIAHGRLATSDLFAALGATVAVFALWRYVDRSSPWRLALAGLALGFANTTKYTSLLLYPLVLILLVAANAEGLIQTLRRRRWKEGFAIGAKAGGEFLLISAISLLIINGAFLFNGSFRPISEYSFQAKLVDNTRQVVLKLGDLPAPLPAPFLEGMDATLHGERTGGPTVSNLYYMFGEIRDVGFKGYYLVATLFKVPLGSLLLFTAAVLGWLRKRKRFKDNLPDLFLLIPILYFGIYFNLILRYTKGIRHFLVVFPFALVFAGSLVRSWDTASRRKKLAVLTACVAVAASVLSYFPHYISYFNELVPIRRRSYKILADSNLDWGQNQWYLERYRESHPEAQIDPHDPVAGTVVVSANELIGILGSPDDYRWLRENFEPTGTIAYSYLVYEVPPDNIDGLEGTETE